MFSQISTQITEECCIPAERRRCEKWLLGLSNWIYKRFWLEEEVHGAAEAPYTSPYSDASHLDPRTDVSEKRIVGVFHELLHLTIQKKTERKNVSNLRKPLCNTLTVVLREAYDGQQLLEKHPLVDIREKYARMMERGMLDKSRGLYKKSRTASLEDLSEIVYGDDSLDDGTIH
ncbi:hypothetical protein JCGZ_20231 [Jatropha curcas]|uniref:PORR domain-containing protein n=1 Tax=Jatropha curcas TaxID=180498 RepID=A0A067K6Q1_JATCU|nr:hypothetical protein JCGZ_20231 [Jatropha curcas]